MTTSVVRLSVPAQPSFARSVRMMAANLAILCPMSVDEVEDARMAAEEAFIYACATRPDLCEVTFNVSGDELVMEFSLGESMPSEEDELFEQFSFAELLLTAVSDECALSEDKLVLNVVKRAGGAHAA